MYWFGCFSLFSLFDLGLGTAVGVCSHCCRLQAPKREGGEPNSPRRRKALSFQNKTLVHKLKLLDYLSRDMAISTIAQE